MTLNFPNASRSFDERRNLVRFWGYDSALEVCFFIEVGALHKLLPQTQRMDAEWMGADCLDAFDSARERILEAACKVYSRRRPGPYLLGAEDF